MDHLTLSHKRLYLWLCFAVSAIILCLYLGYWQLQRAQYKETLKQALLTRSQQIPLEAYDLQPPWQEEWLFRKVKLYGVFDAKHQLLLDNRHYNHQVGFQVITPFRINTTHQIVLIDRGWLPKEAVASLTTPTHPIRLTGTIGPLLTVGWKIGPASTQINQWPQIIQFIDIKSIGKQLKHPILPMVIHLPNQHLGGFTANWHPITTQSHRHRAYALQWFLLAIALLGLTLWLMFFKKTPL